MENVIRTQDTRRFSDRRSSQVALAISERRSAERRNGIERRQNTGWLANWLHAHLPVFMQSLLVTFIGPRNTNHFQVPLWSLLSLFVVGFLYLVVNYETAPLGGTTTQSGYETSEVIVFDPSAAMSSDIVRSGYAVIETMDMRELGITVQRLRIPAGMTVPEALTDLRSRYPEIEVDVNSLIAPTD
ncbi:MAG: hypothetical protein H8E36_01755 [Rhodospirillaceae bacterium]|nr:hypothetical protein [Rhodospirillaceae bacterium]MBL6941278.1 hypothetical protein [Rhodospirillales bacterium]